MTNEQKIIVVFGATGTQGSGVVNVILDVPNLKEKYSVRCVTRDPTSEKAKKLFERGVQVVKGDMSDLASLQAAVRGAYGAFGMTDFWGHHSKELEIEQGKLIFQACQAEGVRHLVFSTLPHATRETKGVLSRLEHFDSKAEVAEYIEANKGGMLTSYVLPAMFMSFIPNLIRKDEGRPLFKLPFPSKSSLWPFIDPPRDLGKYVLGLLERGDAANGVRVHAVSCWTTPSDIAEALSRASGTEIGLETIAPDVFAADYPENIAAELTETLQIIGDYSLYGIGEEKNQAEHDVWLVEGAGGKIGLENWIAQNGPWTLETTGFLEQLAEKKRSQSQPAEVVV